jgi:hypothetical protein
MSNKTSMVVLEGIIELYRSRGCGGEDYVDVSRLKYTHGWGKSCTKVVLL